MDDEAGLLSFSDIKNAAVKAVKKVASVAASPIVGAYNVLQRVPLRTEFSPSDQAFLSTYGNFPITKITVCRTPLTAFVGFALNALTLGKWAQATKKYGYDKIFHLFLLVDITDNTPNGGGKTITAIYEKNETPRCHLNTDPPSNTTETMPVTTPYSGTLNTMINAAIAEMGANFWNYDGLGEKNCQSFLVKTLGLANLLTPALRLFIYQPLATIGKELPSWTAPIAKGITDTARKLRTLAGKGLAEHPDMY
jgi:hypothetical protein